MAEDDVKIVWDDPVFDHAFKSWDGMTGVWVREKTSTLEILAKVSAGFDTGRLDASISTSEGHSTGGDLEAKTGANPGGSLKRGYSFWHHEGTLPHEIRAKPGGVLRFRSHGIVVYAKRVLHPGTQPSKYLTRWLRGLF